MCIYYGHVVREVGYETHLQGLCLAGEGEFPFEDV